jgi:hypothetical protein
MFVVLNTTLYSPRVPSTILIALISQQTRPYGDAACPLRVAIHLLLEFNRRDSSSAPIISNCLPGTHHTIPVSETFSASQT